MLGNGCPWYGTCKAAKSSGFQGKYCSSDIMSRTCPHRPMNYANEKVQEKFSNARRSHDTTKSGQGIIIVVLIIIAAVWLLPKFM